MLRSIKNSPVATAKNFFTNKIEELFKSKKSRTRPVALVFFGLLFSMFVIFASPDRANLPGDTCDPEFLKMNAAVAAKACQYEFEDFYVVTAGFSDKEQKNIDKALAA